VRASHRFGGVNKLGELRRCSSRVLAGLVSCVLQWGNGWRVPATSAREPGPPRACSDVPSSASVAPSPVTERRALCACAFDSNVVLVGATRATQRQDDEGPAPRYSMTRSERTRQRSSDGTACGADIGLTSVGTTRVTATLNQAPLPQQLSRSVGTSSCNGRQPLRPMLARCEPHLGRDTPATARQPARRRHLTAVECQGNTVTSLFAPNNTLQPQLSAPAVGSH